MTPQFLRAEAARFREMADAAEREASKSRLLAMAADYEARADATGVPPEPVRVREAPAEADPAPAAPPEATKVRTGRRLTLERKDPA